MIEKTVEAVVYAAIMGYGLYAAREYGPALGQFLFG